MKSVPTVPLVGFVLAALGRAMPVAAATTEPASTAAAPQPPQTYTVTTIAQTAAGRLAIRETLSLTSDGERRRLNIANASDGSIVSVPITLTSEGAIATTSQDSAVTCYNMAIDAVAHDGQPAAEPAAAFVLFGNSVVRVPLAVRNARTLGRARVLALSGTSSGAFTEANGGTTVAAGIQIDATVDTNDGQLRAATFNEAHYVGAPAQIVGRSTCTLTRIEREATTRT